MNKLEITKIAIADHAIRLFNTKQKIQDLKAKRNLLFAQCDCYSSRYTNCYSAHFHENAPVSEACPPMVEAIGIAQTIHTEKSSLSGIYRNIKNLLKKNNLYA